MSILSNIFGGGNQKVKTLLDNGAVVIDVRTPGEFQGGNVAGSINIPLQEIQKRVNEIKEMNKPIVLCCASGMRSGQASGFLKKEGVACENGGGWKQVNTLLKETSV